jgi:DHA1 family bicyclomycin/chloramphenicol resistance-like MFS transporter
MTNETSTKQTHPFQSKVHYFFFMSTIILVAAVGFFASDIYLPSLPFIAQYFSKTTSEVSMTMSVFLLAMALFQVFIGALSDKFGRKQILFVSLSIFIVSSLACAHSQTLNQLILSRFFQGIGAACGLSIGQAIIADLFGPIQSAKPLSILIPLVAFSPAVAPILGGLIEEHSSWRMVFLFLAFYGFTGLFLCLTPIVPKLKHHEIAQNENGPKFKFLHLLKNKEFFGFALFMMNSNACYFAFLSATPFLLKTFGYTPTQVGYAFCAASFPYMFASFIGRKLAVRLSHLQIILCGLLIDLFGVLLMFGFAASHWPNMASIMIPIFFITSGNGLIMPYSSASAISIFPKNAGLVTGTLATLQLCAASLGTFMMGLIANGTLFPLAGFNLAVVIVTLVYFFFVFGNVFFSKQK